MGDVPPAELIAWRRRALEQQLPAAGFPAGSSAPALVFLVVMMVVAAAGVLGFAVYDHRGVPAAVHDSQRDLVVKVARTISISSGRAVTELDRDIAAVRRAPVPPDADVLARLVGDRTTWNGAAIVQTATRQPVTADGVAIPLELLPNPLPADATLPVTTSDGPALLRVAALDATRTMVVQQPLLMRNLRLNPEARHGVFMVTPDGSMTLMQGIGAVDTAHLRQAVGGLARAERSESRAVAVKEWTDRQLVVSAAPIGDTGIVVVSVITAVVTEGTSLGHGLLLAVTLLAVAVASFALMRTSLVGPLQELLRQAKADACGAPTVQRRSLRIAEAYRIAQALAVVSGAGLRGRRWRPTAMQGLAVAAVVALVWPAVAVVNTLHAPQAAIPEQLYYDEESRAEAVGAVLGNALDSGMQTVSRISLANARTEPGAFDPVLKQGLAEEYRFRGLYLVDPKGAVVRSAGRDSLRTAQPLPGEAGVRIDPGVQRLPVIYAFRVADNGYAVVGEFDIDYLLGVVRQVDGRARVADANLRTVLDSTGYKAFEPLSGTAARAVAIDALAGGTVRGKQTTGGQPALLAAAGLNSPPTVAHLEWVVVVERNPVSLRLPQAVMNRWTLLMAGIVVGVVALTLAWQYFVFVYPLRRLAARADRIVAGSFEDPVPPQRHDDIGAIAMCLEICRQVRHTGSARFGGAIRLRGSEDDYTAVMPKFPRQRTKV
ncbi:HAMP domain-containing protein [Dactylosporangium sp. NPDC005572]|uniref:HAMP domain-containing protein n=1 Tax=Dactylosporangium sp. NPDC005572 TaxID=3156889 RepID=UPI0033A26019